MTDWIVIIAIADLLSRLERPMTPQHLPALLDDSFIGGACKKTAHQGANSGGPTGASPNLSGTVSGLDFVPGYRVYHPGMRSSEVASSAGLNGLVGKVARAELTQRTAFARPSVVS
jgi:hypothetical protein